MQTDLEKLKPDPVSIDRLRLTQEYIQHTCWPKIVFKNDIFITNTDFDKVDHRRIGSKQFWSLEQKKQKFKLRVLLQCWALFSSGLSSFSIKYIFILSNI